MRTGEFGEWYRSDALTPDGWLHPGATVSNHANWHCSDEDDEVPVKWAYLAVDARANDYFAEAIVPAIMPIPLKA